MSYNLIYGAWAGYGSDGSGVNYQWGLWYNTNCTSQANVALSDPPLATPYLWLFDPGNSSWQSYIDGQEKDADEVYPFDGWQADGFGNIGTVYTCAGASVNLANEFSGFLTTAYNTLGGNIVFNAVGQYGQQQIATNSDLAFLYTECWPFLGQTTYDDLQNAIYNNDTWSSNTKASVLAAYPDQSYANSYSSTDPGFFNTPGVLYEDATIFASGGDHIELGDVDHMLDAPNYLNGNLYMTASLQQSMVNYYNFLTAYEDLLRGGETPNSNVIEHERVGGDGLDLRKLSLRHRRRAVHQYVEPDKQRLDGHQCQPARANGQDQRLGEVLLHVFGRASERLHRLPGRERRYRSEPFLLHGNRQRRQVRDLHPAIARLLGHGLGELLTNL
jgi:dextranase